MIGSFPLDVQVPLTALDRNLCLRTIETHTGIIGCLPEDFKIGITLVTTDGLRNHLEIRRCRAQHQRLSVGSAFTVTRVRPLTYRMSVGYWDRLGETSGCT